MKECYFNKFNGHVTNLSFSTYAKFSEELTLRECAYQGVRNVRFSEKFAYVLNEWSQTYFVLQMKQRLESQ